MTYLKAIAAALTLTVSLPAAAAEMLMITDAYAVSASPTARTGAAFFIIENHGPADDRLVGVTSDAAERVEIHTHLEDASGVMRMIKVEDGIVVPAGARHALRRGGDHIMFLGLTAPFDAGRLIPVTLIFEQAGEIAVEIPVDLNRPPEPASGAMHGG